MNILAFQIYQKLILLLNIIDIFIIFAAEKEVEASILIKTAAASQGRLSEQKISTLLFCLLL